MSKKKKLFPLGFTFVLKASQCLNGSKVGLGLRVPPPKCSLVQKNKSDVLNPKTRGHGPVKRLVLLSRTRKSNSGEKLLAWAAKRKNKDGEGLEEGGVFEED